MVACPLGHKHLERWTPALQELCPIMFSASHKCQNCGVIISNVSGLSRNFTTCRNGYTVCGVCFFNSLCPAKDSLNRLQEKCSIPWDAEDEDFVKCPITIQHLDGAGTGCGRCGFSSTRTCALGWSVCRRCYPEKCAYHRDPVPENPEAVVGGIIWI